MWRCIEEDLKLAKITYVTHICSVFCVCACISSIILNVILLPSRFSCTQMAIGENEPFLG